ncbi:hypothetical protein AB0H88_05085 [Nonomuraea sp. NPDC050680]|uniref:hypothetical protein n=1 Tax=Nonomuraea sp. NPDC050680 TaxID=3154630 RepID=UPI0033CA1737
MLLMNVALSAFVGIESGFNRRCGGVLTPAGRAAIERAAPAHVGTVRRLVFDSLSDEELDSLAAITDKVLTQLERDATP